MTSLEAIRPTFPKMALKEWMNLRAERTEPLYYLPPSYTAAPQQVHSKSTTNRISGVWAMTVATANPNQQNKWAVPSVPMSTIVDNVATRTSWTLIVVIRHIFHSDRQAFDMRISSAGRRRSTHALGDEIISSCCNNASNKQPTRHLPKTTNLQQTTTPVQLWQLLRIVKAIGLQLILPARRHPTATGFRRLTPGQPTFYSSVRR